MRGPENVPADPAWFRDLLDRQLTPWLRLAEDQIRQLWNHYEILVRWNQKINLTSIPPGEELVIRHYCESLFFAAHLPVETEEAQILDIGSGGGFPGVPIAILKPGWRIMLLESNQRKSVFLRESTRGLANISVLARRADTVKDVYDWAVSRGVDPAEVVKFVPRLASKIGLMLGEDDFRCIQSKAGIAWSEPVRLPWGDRRICVYGCSTWNAEHRIS